MVVRGTYGIGRRSDRVEGTSLLPRSGGSSGNPLKVDDASRVPSWWWRNAEFPAVPDCIARRCSSVWVASRFASV